METVPWHTVVHKSHLYGDFLEIVGPDGKRVGCTDADDPEHRANAEIMAAGPELVKACRLGVAAIDLTIEAGESEPSESWAGILMTMRAALARLEVGAPTDPRLTAAKTLDGVLADLGGA